MLLWSTLVIFRWWSNLAVSGSLLNLNFLKIIWELVFSGLVRKNYLLSSAGRQLKPLPIGMVAFILKFFLCICTYAWIHKLMLLVTPCGFCFLWFLVCKTCYFATTLKLFFIQFVVQMNTNLHGAPTTLCPPPSKLNPRYTP